MAKNITSQIADASEDVAEVVEDVVEETAEKVEDAMEFLMRPEVIITIRVILITIGIVMFMMKKEDEVEII